MADSEVPAGYAFGARRSVAIERQEAMHLLAGVPFGRVVYTTDALPAVRPVNHVIGASGSVIVRTRPFRGLDPSVMRRRPVVVAYEADDIDPVARLGWSVVVTGLARLVVAPERVAEYAGKLSSWVDRPSGVFIEIEPTLVSGIRLIEEAGP